VRVYEVDSHRRDFSLGFTVLVGLVGVLGATASILHLFDLVRRRNSGGLILFE
jgi:hypothetical protein